MGIEKSREVRQSRDTERSELGPTSRPKWLGVPDLIFERVKDLFPGEKDAGDAPLNRLSYSYKIFGKFISPGKGRVEQVEVAAKRAVEAARQAEVAAKRAAEAVESARVLFDREAREAAWRLWRAEHGVEGPEHGVERAEHCIEVSGEELSARSLESDEPLEGPAKLRRILDQLPLTDQRVRILNDPGQGGRHDPAAIGVLRTLRYCLQGVISVQSPDPSLAVRDAQSEDLEVLELLGEKVHSNLIEIGIFWPPPFAKPPPAASRDLMDMYRASMGRIGRRDQSLRDTLEQLLSRVESLLRESIPHERISFVRRLIARDSHGRCRIELIASSAACVIALMQAPGTIHDFPGQAADLARDVVSAVVEKIASDIGGELSVDGNGNQALIPSSAPDARRVPKS